MIDVVLDDAVPRVEAWPAVTVQVPLYDERYFYREGLDWFRRRSDKVSHVVSNLMEGMGLGRQAYWPAESVGETRPTATSTPARALLRFASRAWAGLIVLPLLGLAVIAVSRRSLKAAEGTALTVAVTTLGVHAVTSVLFLADPRMHVPFDPVLIAALSCFASRIGQRTK